MLLVFLVSLADDLCATLATFLLVWNIHCPTLRATPEGPLTLENHSTTYAIPYVGWVLCLTVWADQGSPT